MPEQNSTLTTKYGGETMEKELELKLKDNLIITSLDGEGLVFEIAAQKTFWINDTATFLLRLLEANREGVSLSSAKSLLHEQYLVDDGIKIEQDFTSFINQLEQYGLVFPQPPSSGTKIKNPDDGVLKKTYIKPIIEDEKLVQSAGCGGRITPMSPGPGFAFRR